MNKKLIRYLIITFVLFSVANVVVLMRVENLNFHDAILITLMLFGAGEPLTLNIQKMGWLTGLLMVSQTILGLATLTIAFGLLTNFMVSEKIAKLMAKEKVRMKDHIIVCGLGNIGLRVASELMALEQKFIVIDRGDEKDYVELLRKKKIPMILDNLKDESVLEEACIADAKSIIICTGNDLLNMELALNVRSKREDIVIVMRMFDQALARKIKSAFNIKVAFSASALAAPVFAAASLDRTIFQTTKVEKQLFVSAKVEVKPNSKILDMSIDDLRKQDLVVLKLISGEERLKFPVGERKFQAGDTVYVTCTLDTLEEMKTLTADQ